MKRSWSCALIALVLAVAACGGGEGGEGETEGVDNTSLTMTDSVPGSDATPPTPGAAVDTGAAAAGGAVTLNPVGNSGISGQANLTTQGGQTQVTVQLTGMQPSSAHAGHVHQGTCDAIGPVVAPLQDVAADASGNGTSTSTLTLPMDSVMNGRHVISYHQAAGANPGPPASCGAIPAHMAGHQM